MRRFFKRVKNTISQDDEFLHALEKVEVLVSKILSIAMILVILVAVSDLTIFLIKDFFWAEVVSRDFGRFGTSLFQIFGSFLNVLIALELLENITAYLRKHVVQVELVIVTSLIAVARKIIILDLERKTASDLAALAFAILAISASYWLIRRTTRKIDGQ
ncbi:phosphate-starvation-inducible PsiE family protein [Pantanalinema rosaneae CENA516]|uniref:phosphate-starvation-inducible PsiE family protein n=1 Tax=Pantanalinema rosaneae TaxID=1620701 RepID=UPI003D6E6289